MHLYRENTLYWREYIKEKNLLFVLTLTLVLSANAVAIEETDPTVMIDYMDQVELQASELFKEVTPETAYIQSEDKTIFTYEVQVDELSSATLTITD